MSINGVIFDFNGTLFWDTEKNDVAWRQIAKNLSGKEITDEEFKNLHGKTNSDTIEHLTGKKPDNETLNKVVQEKESLYRDLCKQDSENFKLAPGATEFLDFLKEKNIPVTIATSSEITNLRFFIKEFDLKNWFDISKIVFDDGTFKGKPEPDIYIKAAKAIDIPTEECLIFEDAISGITSARKAGVGKIIAVSSANNYEALKKAEGVNEVIKDFYQVNKDYFQ